LAFGNFEFDKKSLKDRSTFWHSVILNSRKNGRVVRQPRFREKKEDFASAAVRYFCMHAFVALPLPFLTT
jgi:hypothetical protein